jgi:hypothetical protein
MNKIISILVAIIVIFSGFGIVAATSKYMIVNNQPPNDPKIWGPSIGKVGTEYLFNVVTTDPENQNVSYFIEWGDNTSTGWTNYYYSGQEMHFTHIWYEVNQYPIRCKAKDVYNAESNWTYISIPIMKKQVDNDLINLPKEKYTTMLFVDNMSVIEFYNIYLNNFYIHFFKVIKYVIEL